MNVKCIWTAALLVALMLAGRAMAQAGPTITVHVDQPGAKISPTMWGAFFEDINFGGDGGLYAEMVKNRSFEFPDALMGWTPVITSLARGTISVETDWPFRQSNPHYLRIVSFGDVPIGVSNEGFRGMGVKSGEEYDFSAEIRGAEGSPKVTVEMVGADGTTLASATLKGIKPAWNKITATLKPTDTDAHARMTVFVTGAGAVDLDMVSVFPRKTWMNRPGGLRADMVQMLADLHPGFLRFPGGCIVEGSDLTKRYQWKNTIGPIEDRKLLIDRWNYEFKHRPTPDYFQSFGLGFFEYFQLCEDIGAQPLPLVNCGMACQFNSAELAAPDQLKPYIQDALDLIEFANGGTDTTWGAKRAAMGHPGPFNMRMIGIGNEQWGQQYLDRLALFTKAIKAAHPEIQLVCASGPSPDDERFEYLWPRLCDMKADIVDQHCYANPIWFYANSTRFDHYDRSWPKVFFGEYAAQSVAIVSTKNRNNLECALSEAAYMTGMERNADVVTMASYAPLFSNIDAWQWTPDLIWVDSLRVHPTPSYFVQKLFATNRGDVVLATENTAAVREILPAGRIGVGTNNAAAEFKDVRVSRDGTETALGEKDFAAKDGWGWTDGVLRQGQVKGESSVSAGDRAWKDYTLSLKARKMGGDGSVIVTVLDSADNCNAQWVLGGWKNSQDGIVTHFAEQENLLGRVAGSLEAGQWHDVKIAVKGDQMQCWLDGAAVQSATVLHERVPALFTSAVRDNSTGETILKVVNPGADAVTAGIHLQGASNVTGTGTATVLTGDPAGEDTFANPRSVAPVTAGVEGVKEEFSYTFVPHSLTVLRVGGKI